VMLSHPGRIEPAALRVGDLCRRQPVALGRTRMVEEAREESQPLGQLRGHCSVTMIGDFAIMHQRDRGGVGRAYEARAAAPSRRVAPRATPPRINAMAMTSNGVKVSPSQSVATTTPTTGVPKRPRDVVTAGR